ncbi:MAG: glycosyltransferase family 9 protein, partial [Thermodesulfovibrionales bacterium]
YDVVIDTEQWHRLSAVVAYASRAHVRIGFATNERERLFTNKISYSHDDYEVYSFLRLIEPLIGYIPSFSHDEPFVNVEDNPASLDGHLSENTIAIFPGATVAERRWGGERYGRVARVLVEKGYKVIIIGSEDDREDAAKIINIAPGAIDLTGKTTLKEVASILKRSKLLINADSGLLHLAVAVGTPTVSLFGSGIEKKWAPRGKRHRVINKHLACSPCTKFGYTPECRKGRSCMNLISEEEVLEKIDELLAGNPSTYEVEHGH